ncbi:malonyl-ACP O-methyltransferase BioC [Methylomagnum sp.]
MSYRSLAAHPEKRWIGRSFAAAASGYDGVAGLQRAVGHDLLARWPERLASPGVMVDVGAGTGYFTAELMSRYPAAHLVALDLAEGMLRVAKRRFPPPDRGSWVCGDAEALPLADRSVDVVFSNLAIQWCPDLATVFSEFRRVLKPDGALLFSTFGEATLAELRAAWAAVDSYSHVNDFTPVEDMAAALNEAGFRGALLAAETRMLEYADPLALMRELKRLGAHNVTAGRRRHLTGKRALREMLGAYGAKAGTETGGIRATFEVVYVRAGGEFE